MVIWSLEMAIQAQLYSDNIGFPSQDLMENNNGVCGLNEFSFNVQQKQHQIQQQQQLQSQLNRNQNMFSDDFSVVSDLKNYNINNNNNRRINGSELATVFSQSVAAQTEKQRQEIDRYICLQSERLRFILQEQSKRELVAFLKKIESKTLLLMRQKDEEIAKAANRTMELEIFVRKLEIENQAWQRLAKENEAMVVSLNNTIEQLRESNACCDFYNNQAEDAESCCDENRGDIEEEKAKSGENRAVVYCVEDEEQRKRKMTMLCKSCNSRNSSVLFLPCRHLCSCKVCETFLDSCPICATAKKASIEALIF